MQHVSPGAFNLLPEAGVLCAWAALGTLPVASTPRTFLVLDLLKPHRVERCLQGLFSLTKKILAQKRKCMCPKQPPKRREREIGGLRGEVWSE